MFQPIIITFPLLTDLVLTAVRHNSSIVYDTIKGRYLPLSLRT